MKLSHQSQSLIEATIKSAIEKYTEPDQETVVTDIHIQPSESSGELLICNDDDEELASNVIDEWADSDDEPYFYKDSERLLSTILLRLKEQGEFDNLSIVQPYSFVLVDEDKETISELLLIDEDTLLINDELLKGLDEELDDFLKDLLKI